MDLQSLAQAVVVVRGVIDTVRTVLSLRTPRRRPDRIPVYRLVGRQETPLVGPAITNDLVHMRWPR